MSRVFFIQASLAVKNRLGRKHLFMEKDTSGYPLLKFLIQRVRKVSCIDQVCIVTSDKQIDDEVVSLVDDLAKDTTSSCKPLTSYRVASDKPYAFSDDNILADKLLNNIPLYGLYSANAVVEILEELKSDSGVFLPAEIDITISTDYLEKIISKYGDDDLFIRPLFLFSVNSVKNALRQYLIKRNKDNNIALSNMAADIEELRSLNLYTNEDITDITKIKKTNFAEYNENSQINSNVLLGYMHDKMRKKPIDSKDVGVGMPLLTGVNLSEIRKSVDFLNDITIDKFFEFLSLADNLSGPQAYPGYMEVELTSRCNLACDYCPNTRLKREKEDMPLAKFKEIVDNTVSYVPFLSLSGYGEPLVHPDVVEAVKYAKEKGFFKVCIETNASFLNDDMLLALSKAGLDIIVINLNALDNDENFTTKELPSAALVKRLMDFNEKKVGKKISLVLQVVKTENNNELIEFYYQRFEYLVDKIVIKPFNDFLGEFDNDRGVDFSPLPKDRTACAKTTHSLSVSSSGKPHICMQRFNDIEDDEDSLLSFWQKNRTRGGNFDFCFACRQWHMLDSYSHVIKYGVDMGIAENYIYNKLVPQKFEEGKLFYENKDYEKALGAWESVLRIYPHHKEIHTYLTKMLNEQ